MINLPIHNSALLMPKKPHPEVNFELGKQAVVNNICISYKYYANQKYIVLNIVLEREQ
jgi:hypothetical protein